MTTGKAITKTWIVAALLFAAQGTLWSDTAPVVTHRAAPDGFPGAVLVTADADGAPRFDCVGEAAPGKDDGGYRIVDFVEGVQL